jgi:hypothetical protein
MQCKNVNTGDREASLTLALMIMISIKVIANPQIRFARELQYLWSRADHGQFMISATKVRNGDGFLCGVFFAF